MGRPVSEKSSAEIRASLAHPVIDADGHTVEFFPALQPFLQEEGVDPSHPEFWRIEAGHLGPPSDWHAHTPEERARHRISRGAWSGVPAQAIDRATSLLPALLSERLDDLGIDLSVIYPSFGLLFSTFDDHDIRRGACRSLNRFNAEVYEPFRDRLVSVAAIPMHTPSEAVDELRHAHELGFKAVVMPGWVQRPVAAVEEKWPEAARWSLWVDTFGIDSDYDYDVVWETCRQLGLSPSFHSSAMGWPNRRSVSSYVYNHIGMLGEAHHATAKSLVLGGVTRRFPELGFCFLEGGVSWAVSLFADLIGHWGKRNARALEATDPGQADWAGFSRLFQKYGGPWAEQPPPAGRWRESDLALFDEFAAAGIERAEDFIELFSVPFFFGCEADDPGTATAFDARLNPFGVRLQALFGSDISHWDVPDMSEVVAESWEMVERGLLTEDAYRDFVFTNPVRLYTRTNPRFFEGTRVADAVPSLRETC
jgi:predicted TIM-barrel fold metal-dependent hydrolase